MRAGVIDLPTRRHTFMVILSSHDGEGASQGATRHAATGAT
jgi:hypothetical protein